VGALSILAHHVAHIERLRSWSVSPSRPYHAEHANESGTRPARYGGWRRSGSRHGAITTAALGAANKAARKAAPGDTCHATRQPSCGPSVRSGRRRHSWSRQPLPWAQPTRQRGGRVQLQGLTQRTCCSQLEQTPLGSIAHSGERGYLSQPAGRPGGHSESRQFRHQPLVCDVRLTTGVKLRGPEGAQRLRATSASTAELCRLRHAHPGPAHGDSTFDAIE
jgi:hypothetical protein